MPKGRNLSDYLDIIRRMARNGASDRRIAEYLGVVPDAVQRFRRRYDIAAGQPPSGAVATPAKPPVGCPKPSPRIVEQTELEWSRLLAGRRFNDPHPRRTA